MFRNSMHEGPPSELTLTQHGHLTLDQMHAMLKPGAIDPATIVGRRVRWTYCTTRRQSAEGKVVSDELKKLHMQLGAAEVIVFRGPSLKEAGE